VIRQNLDIHGVAALNIRVTEYAVCVSSSCGLDLDLFGEGDSTGYDVAQMLVAAIMKALAEEAAKKE